MNKIKIILCDDHVILRDGLRDKLNQESDIEVIGEASDGREAIKLVTKLSPDIVVMDISMPLLNGLEATCQIKKSFPDIGVIILTVHENEDYVYQLFNAGASGYLCKKSAYKDLAEAIRVVDEGDYYISPHVSKSFIKEYILGKKIVKDHPNLDCLSLREREILQLVAEGKASREIADLLNISVKTVEAHRTHMMKKLGLRNTANLTKFAIREGIISID